MSTIPLPPMPQAGGSSAAHLPPQVGAATIPSPSPAVMAKFNPNHLLKVHVIDQMGGNRLQVQSPQGPITLNTDLKAPPGTQLTLKLSQASGGALAATIHAGPRATMMMAAHQTTPPQAPASPQAAGPTATPTTVATGQAPPQPPLQPGGPANPPPALTARPTVSPQAQPASPQPQAAQTGRQAAAQNSAPAAGARSAAPTAPVTPQPGAVMTAVLAQPAAGSSLPAGTNLVVTLLSLRGSPPPNVPLGTVTAQLPGGQTMMSTSQGLMSLNTKTPIPVGTQVGFSVSAAPASAGVAQTAQAAAQLADIGETAQLTRRWGGLEEAVAVLRSVDPGAAQAMTATLPTPGPKLASALVQALNLFTGARAGGMPALVGDRAMAALDRAGAKGTVDRLEKDFAKLSKLSSEPTAEGWRSHAVPVQHEGAIDQIRMAVRKAGDDEDGEGDGDGGTRFLVDVAMSTLGRIQLDGLVTEKKRRFDLILRSEEALQAELRQDLSALFQEALDVGGLEGAVMFQVGAARFVPVPGVENRPVSGPGPILKV